MASTRWGTSKNAGAQEARERILDAASRCFDRIGVPKTTVVDAAREAKITRTTLYRYFENREAIVVGVMLCETHYFRERLLEALSGIDDVGEFIVEGILFSRHEAPKRPCSIVPYLRGALTVASHRDDPKILTTLIPGAGGPSAGAPRTDLRCQIGTPRAYWGLHRGLSPAGRVVQ